ncbi:MAG: hypothetical protein PT944_00360 [Actinomycetaceae bacterium]|nr:hypothetical protein [Arcanobacterium sp.]MDD7686358.1 hypothetical protein [Actinomycetaceae bacterium]MDY5274217.1 hypothetical protein [Arcanobacterium sp.]
MSIHPRRKSEKSGDDEPDYEREWDEITKHLAELDRALPPRGSGPRDWEAAESPDEPFDPRQLPSPPRAQTHSAFARAVLALALILMTVTLLALFGLVPLSGWLLGVCALAACVSAAGAIFLYLPQRRDADDDGIML